MCGLTSSLSCVFIVFFFFKQKTAYEMRISDWSSDVCSSDLLLFTGDLGADAQIMFDCPGREISSQVELVRQDAVRRFPDRGVAAGHRVGGQVVGVGGIARDVGPRRHEGGQKIILLRLPRSEEHTSELQSLMRNSYSVSCL